MERPRKREINLESLTEEEKADLISENRRLCSCEICPAHNMCAKKNKELVYCLSGKSPECITHARMCYCVKCPVHFKLKLKKIYYCLRGSELEQKRKEE